MDLDPAVEPELDAFSLFLPLPYRVSLIIVLGMRFCPGRRDLADLRDRCMGMGSELALSARHQDCMNLC